MIIKNLDIDTNCKYVILYRLKSDNSVVACSCSADSIGEKYMKLNDDSGTEVISVYQRSADLEKALNFYYNRVPKFADYLDELFHMEESNDNTN